LRHFYDAASQLLTQAYPNGRKHEHEYNYAGRLVKTFEYEPSNPTAKVIRFEFEYDKQGNLLKNYRQGVGEGRVNEYFKYGYDGLNRLVWAEMYSSNPDIITNASPVYTESYQYDSLGNLTFEQVVNPNGGNSKSVDYKHNNLNQMAEKYVNDNPNQNPSADKYYTYTFDKRGNLIKGLYHQNPNQVYVDEQYVYDATNRMTKGTNDIGETSEYIYNGFGDLVKNVWTVKKNAYGYTGITVPQIEASIGEDLTVTYEAPTPNNKDKKNKMTQAQVEAGGPTINNTTVVIKTFTLDYTSPLKNVIMEEEAGGFTYKYVYGLQKLSVLISPVTTGGGGLAQNGKVKLWYHQDRLGSVDYLSDNVQGKVASYIDYDAWGMPLKKSVLKLGARELDMAIEYTGHPYDAVLGVYYARARMYDAADRRFMAVDPVKGTAMNPQTLNVYVYCIDNPIKYIDPTGLAAVQVTVEQMRAFGWNERRSDGKSVSLSITVRELNAALQKYNLTNIHSFAMFIATVAEETLKGFYKVQTVGNGFAQGGGALQLTHKSNYQSYTDHLVSDFKNQLATLNKLIERWGLSPYYDQLGCLLAASLAKAESIMDSTDPAKIVGEYFFWDSGLWYWTMLPREQIQNKTINQYILDGLAQGHDKEGLFIVANYAVNGFRDTTPEVRDKIARGADIELIKDKDGKTTHLKVDGITVRASINYDKRMEHYKKAIGIWK